MRRRLGMDEARVRRLLELAAATEARAAAAGPSAEMKLGAGTIRLSTTSHGCLSSKTNLTTCLTTVSERGTYKLSRGTGRHAGIRGSGGFTVTDRVVSQHKHYGGCVTNRPPLAVQAIFTLSGSATLRD
jgi:hypothetical protein